MKKLLLVLIMLVGLLLTGCTSEEVEIEEDSTLTCTFKTLISGTDSIAVYTVNDVDGIVSVFVDGEEIQTGSFWNELIIDSYNGDVERYLDDMIEWYTSDVFSDSSCVYE